MYADKTSLHNEKTIGHYGALTLTNKRIIGKENITDLALGGLGKLISRLLNLHSTSHISGTITEIRLDKIDSIRLQLDRAQFLLKISNLLWYATIALLVLTWLINPFYDKIEPIIGIIGFVANLITLGMITGFLESAGGFILSVSSSYEIPIATFALSIVSFLIYLMFKEIRLEIHSSKNFAFTNIFDFSMKGGMKEAQDFARKIREAEDIYSKKN